MAPKIITDSQKVLDVFQPGLTYGSEPPEGKTKRYFYVEHPAEGWRVYLRTACFIHELNKPFEPSNFLVVKRTDGDPSGNTWEPPKGQMEGKDTMKGKTIYDMLRENIRREVYEEAKVKNLRDLQHTGQVLQSCEPNYPPNTFFQYHIFSAYAYHNQIYTAFEKFKWIKEHPEEFAKERRDYREKDDLAWFSKEDTKIMGKWSPTIVKMYLKALGA